MCATRLSRISAANIGPNRFHQNRTVSWLMSIPRSASKSSTLRSDSGYVHHHDQADDLWRAVEISERVAHGMKLPRRVAPRAISSDTAARSNPSSTTTSTGVPRASAPRTERRSCTPTSVGRTTTIRRNHLLKHPTLDQLSALGLHGMAKAFAELAANREAGGLGHHEWLGLLLDREASWLQDS